MSTTKRLHQVAQRVDDLDRAVAFYGETIGLPFIARFDPPGLAFFDLGGTRLLLEAGDTPAALLYLEVDDIVAARDSLQQRGVAFVDEPHCIHRDDTGQFGAPGTEEWMVFFHDSERNLVGLVEPRAP